MSGSRIAASLSFSKQARPASWEIEMAWKTPKIVEISLGCEINSYACAEIKA
jgi:coenzyme PQQ precursor peptide PqqA